MRVSIISVLGIAICISFCTQGCDSFGECKNHCYVQPEPIGPYFCYNEQLPKPCHCLDGEDELAQAIRLYAGDKYACGKMFNKNKQKPSDVEDCGDKCSASYSRIACESPKGNCECKGTTSEAVDYINDDYYCKALPATRTDKCQEKCKGHSGSGTQYFCSWEGEGSDTCRCPNSHIEISAALEELIGKKYVCAETEGSQRSLIKKVPDCNKECQGHHHFCQSPTSGCRCVSYQYDVIPMINEGSMCAAVFVLQ